MASNGALPQTLKSITATKIKELSKQRTLFDDRKKEILAAASAAPDLRARARTLLDGLSRMKGYPKDVVDKDDMDLDVDSSSDDSNDADFASPGMGQLFQADHSNIRRFLLQGRYDASISDTTLRGWIAQLEEELRYLELKHEHASFYSKLVTEWLSHLDERTTSPATENAETKSTMSITSFETVGRAEMHEQRAQWESLVFTPAAHVNEAAIRSYLDELFAQTKLSRQALKVLRESLQKFGTELATKRDWLDVVELEWVSEALMKTDLLSDEKTTILKEFRRNEEVMQEVADVLNMRLATLDSWAWGVEGIPIEMRRQLNGKYRFYMDEDLLDSLLLQYLGTTWAVKLRSVFEEFTRSHAWKGLREDIPDEHKKKRNYSLGPDGQFLDHSVNELRTRAYRTEYFMSQLPESIDEGARKYDDDGAQANNALETKHSLLHLLITESIIHKAQRGEFTAIRSDFQWFGPSMPHTTILTVMDYFGVPQMWLNFFKVFLAAPLHFVQDGPDAPIQVRRRGLPMSHTLCDCFGESVLFSMDYAVNQATSGAFLYRLHDDFWFWGSKETCVKAWESMTKFTNVMGLTLNQEKTGMVHMKTDDTMESHVSGLPAGDIRWGFLVLDGQQGRFVIDQTQVDQHIEELSRQLSSCKSVFAWVQAWNGYFGRFFSNNFARPAMCFGRDHIDMAISTLSRIEQTLFNKTSNKASEAGSGVTNYLRTVIGERFDIHDLPEGFFYYPVELGGLGLLNPYVRLLSMRENIKQTPQRRLQKASLEDEMRYQSAKEKFEKNGSPSHNLRLKEDTSMQFMSLEEYTQYPETYSKPLADAHQDLTKVPDETSVECTAGFQKSQAGLKFRQGGPISPHWHRMSPYWRWVAELYHDEMVRTYGSLAAVHREFMPLGVVQTLREGRFRWQG